MAILRRLYRFRSPCGTKVRRVVLNMESVYEAIEVFEDGRVKRCFAFQLRVVAITEHGVDGLLDLIYLNDSVLEESTPELLPLTLD